MPQGIDQTIEAILEPLRRQDAELQSKRAELRAELEALNRQRAKVGGILRAAEKSLGVVQPPKRKRGARGGGRPGQSSERIDELETWLRANVNGDEFTAPEIIGRREFEPLHMEKSYLSKALLELHSRGTIRLVRTGGPGQKGRTRTWKVATDAKT